MLKHGSFRRNGFEHISGPFCPMGKFGRMFPDLAPFEPPIAALDELAQTMIDNGESGDNLDIPAGYTYLGQFIDHDITFDPTSLKESQVDPLGLRNFRTPALDLDCLYGGGRESSPFMYRRDRPDFFILGRTAQSSGTQLRPYNDLPRFKIVNDDADPDADSDLGAFALIGDKRNDENLLVAQTHVAFLKFHNKVMKQIHEREIAIAPGRDPFTACREIVTWHYQWIVVHDFLSRVVMDSVLREALASGPSYYFDPYDDGEAYIPVEFSAAAYRLGHSMVRQEYEHNRFFNSGPDALARGTFNFMFKFTGLSGTGSDVPLPSNWIIDWNRFYKITDGVTPQFSRALDPFLAPVLANIPNVGEINSLAQMNLRRGRQVKLPTGQSVAAKMNIPVEEQISRAELGSGPDGAVAQTHNFDEFTPLWYYILKEAQIKGGGRRLGPVGSRLLVETFVGLLSRDPGSFLSQAPGWKPILPGQDPSKFTMPDLLRYVNELNPLGDA